MVASIRCVSDSIDVRCIAMKADQQSLLGEARRDRVEVGHISEDAGLVRERYIGVFLHALIQVHVHVLHDETDVCLVATIMDSHELDHVRMTETAQ